MRFDGVVCAWNDERGFGFIEPTLGGQEIFVRVSAPLAQQLLRHKSTKVEFRSAFWGTVAVNVVAFVVLCSPLGRSFSAAQ